MSDGEHILFCNEKKVKYLFTCIYRRNSWGETESKDLNYKYQQQYNTLNHSTCAGEHLSNLENSDVNQNPKR